ncbi:MAG: hypothetical protein MUF58_18890 [Arcicella sp.]|jgi:hypothetical protein|nr:hypothetical protein [Arcicella sp.]
MTPQEEYYNELLTQFGQITTATMFITFIVALFNVKYFNKPLWIFFGYIVATILSNAIEQLFIWSVNTHTDFWLPYLRKFGIGDTHFLGIISTLKNFLLIGWFYATLLEKPFGKYVQYVSIFLAFMSVIDYIWITGYHVAGVLMPTLTGFFTMIVPMLYLWFLYHRDNKISLYKIPYFWFSIALIVAHLLGLLFYFVSEKLYQTNFILFVKISIVRNIVTILRHFVFAYGFWLSRYVRFFK